jgi:copper transport protein
MSSAARSRPISIRTARAGRFAVPVALLVLPLAWPAWAQAHATLIATSPGAGTVVKASPQRMVLTFDQPIRPVAGGTTVVDSAGRSVMSGPAGNAPGNARQLVVPLKPDLSDGDYTIRWEIVSTDGHLIAGVYAIGVGSGRPPPEAESQETPTDWPFLIARFFYFAGLLVLVGGVVYRVAAYQPSTRNVEGEAGRLMSLRERHRANQVLALSAVLVLAGGWVALTRQGAQVAGVSFWEAFDHRGPVASALDATRFGRQFGRGIDVTAVFTILVALAYAAVAVSRKLTIALAVPAAIAGAWALAAPGISGHAGDPGRGPLVIALDAVHVAAAAVWIGGLVQLAVVTPHATRGLAPPLRAETRAQIAARFSRMALVAVAVLAVSGGLRALWELSAVSQLWSTSYGRTLVVKTVLLLMTLAIASRSRRLLGRYGRLRRSITAELVVLTAVVAAVALLTNLPPGSRPAAAAAVPAGGPATVSLRGGGEVSVWPGLAGPNAVRVSLPSTTEQPRVTVGGETTAVTRVAPHTWLAWARNLPAGKVPVKATSGTSTWNTSVGVGEAVRSRGVPPAPLATGPVAAGEASDLAVAAQRIGNRRARFTVLAQDGSASRALAVVSNGTLATPCLKTVDVCFEAPVGRGAEKLAVTVLRPGRGAVKTVLDLPAADAPRATGLVRQTVTALHRLRSVRIENDLASDPIHSVHTTFIANSPDRLSIDVRGGTQSRLIGGHRWDLQDGRWVRQPIQPSREPDPFWASGQVAAYRTGQTKDSEFVTLAVNEGPTFFRLEVDRRTHLVRRLWMITAAHFMHETYLDPNTAPEVTPPPASG